MINHYTGFLNKCVLVFKRDKPPRNIVIRETENTAAFGLGIFCVTNDEFLSDYSLQKALLPKEMSIFLKI